MNLIPAMLTGPLLYLATKSLLTSPYDEPVVRRRAIREFLRNHPHPVDVFKHEEHWLRNSCDEILYSHFWYPDSSTSLKGIVCFLHGYADHSSLFARDAALRFLKEGYLFAGIDHIGHGQSDGVHVYIERWQQLVEDAQMYIYVLHAKFPTLPIFLYGESMGGAIAISLARIYSLPVNGIILSAPMAGIDPEIFPPKMIVDLLLLLQRLKSTRWLPVIPSRSLDNFLFRRADQIELFHNIPAKYRLKPRISTGVNLLLWQQENMEHAHEIAYPLLLLHGTNDRITSSAISKKLVDKAGVTDKTIITYEDAYHCLLSGEPEEQADKIFSDMLHFTNAHLV